MVPAHSKRLAGLVNRPGGITEDEAVAAAAANLETIRDKTLQELGVAMLRMHEIGALLQNSRDLAALGELYDLSNMIIGVAGVFGMAALSGVAYSLCELIDRLRISGTWNSNAIRVHLDSLRLMHVTNPDEQEVQAICGALRRLVDRVPTMAA